MNQPPPPAAPTPRFELRTGKWGPYFHDTQRGGPEGYDMPLDAVLEKLNRLETYTQRLAVATGHKSETAAERDRLVKAGQLAYHELNEILARDGAPYNYEGFQTATEEHFREVVKTLRTALAEARKR